VSVIDTYPEHFVQFYESEDFFLDSLASYIAAGLSADEAVVVVATKSHLEALDNLLRQRGFDSAAAEQAGNYLPLNAHNTLVQLMVNGTLSAEQFKLLLGGAVARAARHSGRVRVFGELVALLWADENYQDAIRLEKLWNELQTTQSFTLFCAYPMASLGRYVLEEPFAEVCTTHTRVIPGESYSALTESNEQLRAIVRLQQKASALEREISERQRAEESLRLAKAELEELLAREQIARSQADSANRMKDEFLATVSHELRTPLNAILGWAHMLRSGRLEGETAIRAIETIERNAKSQAQLVEDILDVSRMITGKLKLQMESVDIASVIDEAVDSVQLAADSKQIQLEVTLDPTARNVLGDAGRLQQTVWNLVSNAIKFTPPGGRVTVKLERCDANIIICVSDTGQGISADFLPCVFDRFRQGDATSSRRHGGLGLGLAIVRHLVELHGGEVSVASEGEGRGATFKISLPAPVRPTNTGQLRANTALLADASEAARKSLPSLSGMRVLVVDDDGDNLQMIAALLEQSLADVQVAKSAVEAMEALEWYQPDVLVLDLAMPGEDGYALIQRIRSQETERIRNLPAIALTAHVRVDDRVRALSAGFDLFLPKPVEFEELLGSIVNASRVSR
jgi:signal transduction histidine kinase/ActR/RegA family two-component response regulator